MKKNQLLLLTALVGGAAAFALRTLQLRTGFEADTGLPLPGNPYALGLPLLLAGLAALILLLARQLPEDRDAASLAFPAAFPAPGAGGATLLVMGAFLLAASGAYSLYSGALLAPARSELALLGALAMLSAGCLLPVIAACRRQTAVNGNLLLAPVAFLVVRLVLQSRKDSINPTLEAYYPELLALVFLILGFYYLAAFAFGGGRTRRFAACAALSVVLCAPALAGRPDWSALGLYGGGIFLQLGFLLLRLDGLAASGDAPDSSPS